MTFRVPAPISFILVVAAIVALVIFFGAWAVSADSQQLSRTLSISLSASPDQVAEISPSPSDDPFKQAWPDASKEGGSTADDSWWKKSLLSACPFH